MNEPAAGSNWKALSFAGRLTRGAMHEAVSTGPGKNRRPHAGTLQQACRGVWEGTRDHDVSQNIAALLRFIESEPPFMILDFGLRAGTRPQGVCRTRSYRGWFGGRLAHRRDGRGHSGCEVWQRDFLKLDLPRGRFDGVFANAALFHVPSQELPRVLRELHASLKPVACCSVRTRTATTRKAGTAGATACIMILRRGAALCQVRGSSSLRTIGAGRRAREQQHWLASVWRS